MGVYNSLYIFQENISEMFKGLEMVRAYIDDVIAITKNYFKDHLKALEKVLQRIAEAGLEVNAENPFFG